MKVRLVFDDWRNKDHESIYCTTEGTDLNSGDFHSGTTFTADIELDYYNNCQLTKALAAGYVPVFYVIPMPLAVKEVMG